MVVPRFARQSVGSITKIWDVVTLPSSLLNVKKEEVKVEGADGDDYGQQQGECKKGL